MGTTIDTFLSYMCSLLLHKERQGFRLVSLPDPVVAQARAYPSLPISLLLGQDACKLYFLDVLASWIIQFCQWEVLTGE